MAQNDYDARVLNVYGVDREQRAILRRIAGKKNKRSVSELIRDYINRLIEADKAKEGKA